MAGEHPQGAGPLVGRQLRYLVGSEHGWLGAFGFAAPSLRLAPRDKWIGWDAEQRRAQLHGVVGMNRFLIRPSVHCHNLASRLLSMGLERLKVDFQRRYHYSPLLVESFLDKSRFSGVIYRAANWILVGQSQGRGRQERFNKREKTIKDIYVYPLAKDFRQQLGNALSTLAPVMPGAGLGALGPGDGLDGKNWAQNEFGGAELGDKRLNARLVEIAAAKAEKPGRSYAGAVKGSWPETKALAQELKAHYYRLIDHPDEEAVNMENILRPHRERTIRRMQDQEVVLCLQDGTDLNYTSLAKCEGLGVIGTNQTDAMAQEFKAH